MMDGVLGLIHHSLFKPKILSMKEWKETQRFADKVILLIVAVPILLSFFIVLSISDKAKAEEAMQYFRSVNA